MAGRRRRIICGNASATLESSIGGHETDSSRSGNAAPNAQIPNSYVCLSSISASALLIFPQIVQPVAGDHICQIRQPPLVRCEVFGAKMDAGFHLCTDTRPTEHRESLTQCCTQHGHRYHSGRRAPTARIEWGTLFHRSDTSCSSQKLSTTEALVPRANGCEPWPRRLPNPVSLR